MVGGSLNLCSGWRLSRKEACSFALSWRRRKCAFFDRCKCALFARALFSSVGLGAIVEGGILKCAIVAKAYMCFACQSSVCMLLSSLVVATSLLNDAIVARGLFDYSIKVQVLTIEFRITI